MAVNTFKLKEETSKGSLFSRLERLIKLEGVFAYGLPLKYLPYVLFVTAVGIFYIGNSHYAEKNIRKIDALKKEIEDLRADYTDLKADYMYASKQSEVAKKVEKLGVKESLRPPEKIVVTEK
ncbi:MAG: FtsL-like putative cell division protein [Bacteroidota bacterium]